MVSFQVAPIVSPAAIENAPNVVLHIIEFEPALVKSPASVTDVDAYVDPGNVAVTVTTFPDDVKDVTLEAVAI